MESISTPQTTHVPSGLRDPAFRFLPLFRGSKAALVDGEMWQQGLPYDEILENFFNGSQALPSMVGQNKGQLIHGGDIGVRLEKSGEHGLVVLDADVVLDQPFTTDSDGTVRYVPSYHSGTRELMDWLRDGGFTLPPTLMVRSPGRDDGTHAPGWHIYYRQNPAWRVLGLKKPTEHVEVKTNGIVRFTDRCEVLRDLPVAVLPEDLARALQGVVTRRAARADARLGGSSLAEQGVNSALVCLRGWLTENGVWWNDDQIKDIVRHANAVLDVPMDEDRLEKTVLKNKAWTRGGQR